jgi:hypothetical protein
VSDDTGFATWLLEQRLLSKDDLRRARDAQRGRLGRLDTEIVDLKLMTESAVLEALGKYHRTRTVTGAGLEYASPAALRMVTPRIASRLGVVPFKLEGKTLSVATLDPGDLLVVDEIAQLTGCMVASFVTLEIRFVEALHRHYQAPITARYAGLIRRLSGLRERSAPATPVRTAEEDAPVEISQVLPEAPAEPIRRAPAPPADRALELSADELDLFPSLREEAAAAEPSLAGEVTLAREAPAPSPPPPPSPAAPRVEPPPEPFLPPPETAELTIEGLLQAAAHAMQNVEMRDDIADAMLGFCAPLLRRRMMLVQSRGAIVGWRGEGAGVDPAAVRAISIPADEPSVFSGLLRGVEFWLGPLPAMPHNADLTMALGGPAPRDCLILPVRVKDKTVCFLYGDNQDAGVAGLPLGELRRLAAKAGIAFQVYLLKGKLRRA